MKGGGVNIPDKYTIDFGGDGTTIQVDSDLDNIHVKELPKFEIAVTEFPTVTVNSNLAVTKVAPLTATVGTTLAITEIPPVTSNVNVAITQIPEQRVHYPAHYQVCFSLLGFEIWSVSLCGEAQMINENFVPRRTETCK